MASKQITDHFKQRKGNRDYGKQSDGQSTSKAAIIDDLQLLREFDLNWEFGPCSGLTRLERWNRAQKFGLNPPQFILNLIKQNSSDRKYTENIWSDINI